MRERKDSKPIENHMGLKPKLIVHTGAKTWDTIWKWTWFTKDQWQPEFRKSKEGTRRALDSLLGKLGVKTILDCSCGLGLKTIILSEMGYRVEGCDGSRIAVAHAAELAEEEGQSIRFFHSRWERLGKTSGRRYDCVYNDAFAWVTSVRSLIDSAKGISAVLEPGGKFIFQGADQWSGDQDKGPLIKRLFEKESPFETLPIYEKNGVRLTVLITREMTQYGVLGNRIHIIDDHGTIHVEVARVLNSCRWTWSDYVETFRKAGFRQLYSVKECGVGPEPYIFNVAVK